ncbi:MAG: glycosyltransferase [Chloroflexi bacterium]|nr:glycosyltransferase [Chloroflexota bacterium]
MPHILFVHNHPARFVQIDLALLREGYAVREWCQRSRIVNVAALARALAQSDLVFGWFATWHTLMPVVLARALGRPSVLVVGGYDTANMPEIEYGNMRGGLRRFISRTTMRSASRLITNSSYTRDEAIRNAGVDSNRVSVIYHGLECRGHGGSEKKGNLAITIGNVDRWNLHRKGLEPFVQTARLLPDVSFAVIGAWQDRAIEDLRSIAPANVEFTGRVSDGELDDYIARARVYVQASRHEGFGMAVAEAMLGECVPVVTRAGALPEVVGNCGVYVDVPEPELVAKGVRRAFEDGDGLGSRARERVLREFPLERRRSALFSIIDETLDHHD